MQNDNWSLAITGSGGSGSVTAGMILLEALAIKGLYGVMTRSYGPQIRGGESAVMIRFGTVQHQTQADKFDILVSLDWEKVDRFAEEIPLDENSLIIGDERAGDIPAVLLKTGAKMRLIDFRHSLKGIANGRSNMLALGVLGQWIGLSDWQMLEAIHKVLGSKSDSVLSASEACIKRGLQLDQSQCLRPLKLPNRNTQSKRWNISGNEGSAFGALAGGVRFVAAYPITPATDLLEWLAPRLEKIGGALLQAEDELASINMIIGSSFGGVPSLTATSGPGLSLMSEALGLAVASEIPLVVVNVVRGGPSTGIPTKSEQSDLNLAIYGMHGDAPHIVVAPLNIKDCVNTTQWAVSLAETLQCPAIVLTDQMMAQARAIIDAPVYDSHQVQRLHASKSDSKYNRYQLLETGVSPMSYPGDEGLQYTADGLEHNERGTPSSLASDHEKQSAKRRRKLESFDYGDFWADVEGQGETVLISWGSSSEVVQEAAARLRNEGIAVKTLCLRLLSPLPTDKIKHALKTAKLCIVIELNESGQLFHYLASYGLLPARQSKLCRPGPLFFRPGEIVKFVAEEIDHAG